MKNRGFTLIELLAVIVILAIIALIATPMILGVIETARKGAAESSTLGYIDAVEKQIMINQLDSSTTQIKDGVYDLPIEGISVKGENPSEGWIVIENGEITNYSMKIMDYIVTKGEDATKEGTVASKPSTEVSYICKRATTLHTEECTQTDTSLYCSGAGYTANGTKGTTTITYGNLGTTGTLTSGDAFDCDVNGDGTYDSETERFYYVSGLNGDDTSNIKVLIYYSNTTVDSEGNIQIGNAATNIAYHSSDNWHGPVEAIKNLPTINEWTNEKIIYPMTRAIITETGSTSTTGGELPTEFSYTNGEDVYAARLLTVQEINSACNIKVDSSITELDTCNYLIENTKYSNSNIETYGYWLENSRTASSSYTWSVGGDYRYVYLSNVSSTGYSGVRPAIEVSETDILY